LKLFKENYEMCLLEQDIT